MFEFALEIFEQVINWFSQQNQFVKIMFIFAIGYVFILGLVTFIKDVLIKVPIKLLEIICFLVVLYLYVINFVL